MYEDIFGSIRKAAEKRNLRERTIQLYCSNIRYFLRCTNKPVTDLTLEDADVFLTMKRLEGRSPETHNHYRSSIKFLYKRVLKIAWDDEEVPAMKRERNLPAVLTPQEINAVIEATDNLKHKAIIATMYSSGLRVSEVVHLHYDDVSRTNMTIHVREAKGRIDRYTILSQRNLDLLTEYWFQCGRPKGILFQVHGQEVTLIFQASTSSSRQALRRPASHAVFLPMRAATALPATCLRAGLTSNISSPCSVMWIPVPQMFISMSATRHFLASAALSILRKAVSHERKLHCTGCV